ncbi:MAG: lipoyl domain-containing protein [Candidatus Eremiobacteraeota bacterium]|nr:lipoyl domain-containing protein [Candidatus Eremiobacteraeota bacterium]
MIFTLVVPGPIEDVEEIRVLEWHGEPGRRFAPGDVVVELETHKAIVEIRAAQAGILRRILHPEGSWQRLGEPLAILSDAESEPLPATPELGGKEWAVEFQIT